MTVTTSQVQAPAKARGIAGADAVPAETINVKSAKLDVVANATLLYSDSRGAKRTYASDPLFGLEPDANAFAPGKPPLSPGKAFTLFDALKSVGKLFSAEANIAQGSMNVMQDVSSLLMSQLKNQEIYQNDIVSINKSIKADEPPLFVEILKDIFMDILAAVFAFAIGGPVAAVTALLVSVALDVLDQAPVIGKKGHKKTVFQAAFGHLPVAAQIAIKLVIALVLALATGGGALAASTTETVEIGVEEAGDIELDDLASDETVEQEAKTVERKVRLPNAGKRMLSLTITSFLANASKMQSSINGNKLPDGSADEAQFGLFGDIFKSMHASDELTTWLSGALVLVGTIATMGISGSTLESVPKLTSNLMQRVSTILESVLAIGSGATDIYTGVKNFELEGVLEKEANIVFALDELQKQLQSTEFTQHQGELINSQAIKLSKDSMNAVWSILGDFESAVGLKQAV